MKAFPVPFELEAGSSVLVAGCGGGYDVVCALPIALELRRQGHRVHLASNAFTHLEAVPGAEQPFPGLFRVHDRCEPPPNGYFPEGFLAKWWESTLGEELPVWSYRLVGVRQLEGIFGYLGQQLRLNALVVVDGGVDALFWGNEHDQATPTIDAISVLAAYQQRSLRRYFAMTAFGTEGTEHSVRHYDVLEHMARLEPALLGVSALLRGSHAGDQFLKALEYLFARMEPHWHSNMAASIAAAMRGTFGYASPTIKTQTSPLWISILQQLYWFYELDPIAEAKPYLEEGLATAGVDELHELIQRVREAGPVAPWRDIPI